MRKLFGLRISDFGFAGVLVALISFSVDSSAQTVADAARKERERQKQVHSKVVYTNGVPIPAPNSPPAAPAKPSSTTTDSAKKPAGTPAPVRPTDNKGRDEKYWRAAFQKLRDEAKRADDKVQLADLKVKELNTQLLRQSDVYNREYRIGSEIAQAQAELDAARKEAEQARQKIADLEDELRRSGGLPGWAR